MTAALGWHVVCHKKPGILLFLQRFLDFKNKNPQTRFQGITQKSKKKSRGYAKGKHCSTNGKHFSDHQTVLVF